MCVYQHNLLNSVGVAPRMQLTLTNCPDSLCVAAMKPSDQKQLGWILFILIPLDFQPQSIMEEVRAGTRRQELTQKP